MEHHVKKTSHDSKRKAFLSPKIKPFTTKMAENRLMVFRHFYILSFVLDISLKNLLSTFSLTINLNINL